MKRYYNVKILVDTDKMEGNFYPNIKQLNAVNGLKIEGYEQVATCEVCGEKLPEDCASTTCGDKCLMWTIPF